MKPEVGKPEHQISLFSHFLFEFDFGLFYLNDKKINKKHEHNVNIGWLLSGPNLYILTTICAGG